MSQTNIHAHARASSKASTLLYALQLDLTKCDELYAAGEITAAEYLNASIMLEERIDYLITEDLEYKGFDA